MSHMTALAQQQRELLNTIFTTNNIALQATNTRLIALNGIKNRGLQTYQANARASAQRSLQAAYPVIAQLIGEQAFEHLTRDFWAQQPPTRGDLAQWGEELPGFIANIPALQTEPYLSDVATVEWALHTAATAPDKTADLTTFKLLTDHDADALTLQLAPGTALIHSEYPIASVLAAHLYDNPSFEMVGDMLRLNVSETALVWRQDLQPRVTCCSTSEALFIQHLLAGDSLLTAMNAASSSNTSEFDFSGWLSFAVQNGLILGAQMHGDSLYT
jgi:hypothetical protein